MNANELNWISGDVVTYTETVSYGVRDSKGREVGGYAKIEDRSASVDGWVPGFHLRIYSTRDGQRFGALPPTTIHATLDEAKAAAVKALTRAAKRQTKIAK